MTRPDAVAILHYHLRGGGVTRVIEQTCRVLRDLGVAVVVLSGEAALADLELPVAVVPALAYDDGRTSVSAEQLARDLVSGAAEALGRPPDLWHVHNHALGRNVALPAALAQMAAGGRRLLLQVHDFAEDGRPENYRHLVTALGDGDTGRMSRQVYPLADHVHYAVLNRRDRTYLQSAGLPEAQAHLLANPVSLPQVGPIEAGSDTELFLYPTRAIRRKNLGEFLLWACLGGPRQRFAVTMAPQNPAQRMAYDRWVMVSNELNLPVDFDYTRQAGGSYAQVLGRAHALVTTSVAEGFGLVFLEPCLAGRLLLGRRLPQITGDFESAGADLSGLYDRLDVPCAWIDRADLGRRLQEQMTRVYEAYGRAPGRRDVDAALASFVRGDHVDFGRLDEPLQEAILRKVHRDGDSAKHLRPPSLDPGAAKTMRQVKRNQEVVLSSYSQASYGRNLEAIYSQLIESSIGPISCLDGVRLLAEFLDPAQFNLLRT